jgi:cytochrome c oxidase subunit II
MVRLTTTIRTIGRNIAGGFCAALALLLCGGAAWADQPHPWQLGFQDAATPVTERIHEFHNELLVIIFAISLFVMGLLAYVILRFNHRAHPVPTRTSHNTVIEVLWTVVPVLILVTIAIPSFKLMYYMDRVPDAKMTVKVTGHQWYWEYSYPDQGNIDVESRYIHDDDLKPGQLRLLAVDNPMVIPAGKKIRILTGSGDVIHSFFIPSLGVQRYAIPGRTIELWLEADQPGVYYGECNQICGQDHSRMPISVRAVSDADFKAWVEQEKKAADAGRPGAGSNMLASADASAGGTNGIQR